MLSGAALPMGLGPVPPRPPDRPDTDFKLQMLALEHRDNVGNATLPCSSGAALICEWRRVGGVGRRHLALHAGRGLADVVSCCRIAFIENWHPLFGTVL
jgi:hypothetical protein